MSAHTDSSVGQQHRRGASSPTPCMSSEGVLSVIVLLAVCLCSCGGEAVEPETGHGGSTSTTDGAGGATGEETDCDPAERKGRIHGFLFRLGDDHPIAGGLALFRETLDAVPLQVRADSEAHFEVELEARRWFVAAQEGDYCASLERQEVVLEACATVRVDVGLECVLGP